MAKTVKEISLIHGDMRALQMLALKAQQAEDLFPPLGYGPSAYAKIDRLIELGLVCKAGRRRKSQAYRLSDKGWAFLSYRVFRTERESFAAWQER